MPSFSVDGAINSLELTARVTVNDVKINISFGVDGEKDRVDARRLYALWLRFGARIRPGQKRYHIASKKCSPEVRSRYSCRSKL